MEMRGCESRPAGDAGAAAEDSEARDARALEQAACDAGAAGIDILADIQYNCCVRRIVWEEPDSGERSGYGTL